MLMATPLGQTVTVQEVSVALRERGYYPLPVSPAPPVSPVTYKLDLPSLSPVVSIPEGGEWVTDRPPPGYEPVVTPVSPPVMYFQEPDLPVSPSIYEDFITVRPPTPVRHVEMEVTIPPPISPEYVPALSPMVELPPLEPEPPYSPPPGFIMQEFPDGLPGVEPLVEPLPDYLLPDWEVIPPDILPVSPPVSPPPAEKKGPWLIIAVLGAAMLFAGEEKKPAQKRLEDRRLELRRKEQWI